MKLLGLRAQGKQRLRATTRSNHDHPISPNVLHREGALAEPHKLSVGDIPCIATVNGWLFLAVVIGLFSRHPGKQSEPIFHTDPGSASVCDGFRGSAQGVRDCQFDGSMGRCGSCRVGLGFCNTACSETPFASLNHPSATRRASTSNRLSQ